MRGYLRINEGEEFGAAGKTRQRCKKVGYNWRGGAGKCRERQIETTDSEGQESHWHVAPRIK